jgi:hypothetical protein
MDQPEVIIENKMLSVQFSCGKLVVINLSPSLDVSKLVACGEKLHMLSSFRESEPLLKFLKTGTYNRDATCIEDETRCYKDVYNHLHIPSLIRDIERNIYIGLVSGIESIAEVQARFLGYERIDAICEVMTMMMPKTQQITRNQLKDHLKNECALVVFHGERLITLVFDLESCTEVKGNYHSLIEDEIITLPKISNRHFVSYTGERLAAVLPFYHYDELDDCCSLTRHGMKEMNGMMIYDRDEPIFPPLHTIEAVLSMRDKKCLRCLFTRDVYSDVECISRMVLQGWSIKE